MVSTLRRACLAGEGEAELDAAGAPDGDSEGDWKLDSQSGGAGAFLSGDVVLMRIP
jgi:hypothetical protein